MLLLFLFSSLFCADCTLADFGISFGVCNRTTNRRDVVLYQKNESCTPNNIKLPTDPVIPGITCDYICVDDYAIFNFTKNCSSNNINTCCVRCENGSGPDSGEYRYYDWHAGQWPPNFSSKTNYPWRVDNVGITTGPLPPNTTSILEIEVDVLTRNGYLYFEYIAYYTGYGSSFEFLIDGEPPDNATHGYSDWQKVSYDLSFGTHILSFKYHSNDENITSNVEAARIGYIYMLGTTYENTRCIKCLRGQSGSGGRCSNCYVNTFASEEGSVNCTSCDDESFALPGASSCMPRKACTVEDYRVVYSRCSANRTRTKTYYALSPVICNSNLSAPVQNNTVEPCTNCNPGLYYNGSQCVACPSGTYREKITDPDSSCTPCPGGTTAVKTLYFKTMDDIGNTTFLRTSCYYSSINSMDCSRGGGGWNTSNGVMTSGNYYLGSITSTLYANVSSTYESTVEFSFRLHLRQNSTFVYFSGTKEYYDGLPVTYNSSQNSNDWINVTVPYRTKGFTWSFHKYEKYGYDSISGQLYSDYVEIDHIVFHDVPGATGGGTFCKFCPNGTVSAEGNDTCVPCPVGTAALSGAPKCSPCTNNTYANNNGMAECALCGQGSVAVAGTGAADGVSTTCAVSTCGVKVNDTHTFDLNPLLLSPLVPPTQRKLHTSASASASNEDTNTSSSTLYGPLEIPAYVDGTFYLGICTSQGSTDVCKRADNTTVNTKFCEVLNDGEGVDVGNVTNITFFENLETGDHGVNITYTGGDYSSLYGRVPGYRSAEVLFVCVPGSGIGKLQKNKTIDFITTGHQYHFRWETEYACRLCRSEDYQPFSSDCVDRRQTVTYVLNPQAKCTGGALAPEDSVASCTMPAVTMGAVPLILIIIGAIVIIIAVIVTLVVLIRKNRKLKYQLLQKDVFKSGGAQGGIAGAQGMISLSGK